MKDMSSSVPKSVTNIWKILIDEIYNYLTTHQIAERLDMQPNSVLQNVRRNEQYFDILDKKPIKIGIKSCKEFVIYRDKYRCIFCGKQLSKTEALIDTLNAPKIKHKMTLYNIGTLCNKCKSIRNKKDYRGLKAEDFIYNQKYGSKSQENALERIQKIREIENVLPKSNLLTHRVSKSTPTDLSGTIQELIEEIESLKLTIKKLCQTKIYEYFNVNLIEDTYEEEEIYYYWRWDYNPEGGNVEEDYERYWFLSQRGKMTKQGKPRENSLEEVLDHFGRLGLEVVDINRTDSDYNQELDIIFKKDSGI